MVYSGDGDEEEDSMSEYCILCRAEIGAEDAACIREGWVCVKCVERMVVVVRMLNREEELL